MSCKLWKIVKMYSTRRRSCSRVWSTCSAMKRLHSMVSCLYRLIMDQTSPSDYRKFDIIWRLCLDTLDSHFAIVKIKKKNVWEKMEKIKLEKIKKKRELRIKTVQISSSCFACRNCCANSKKKRNPRRTAKWSLILIDKKNPSWETSVTDLLHHVVIDFKMKIVLRDVRM